MGIKNLYNITIYTILLLINCPPLKTLHLNVCFDGLEHKTRFDANSSK